MKYIAYGSNLLCSQMKSRCPDAVLVGTGFITDMRYEFRGKNPNNAHATLVRQPTGFQRIKIPVTVWELSNEDEARLDQYEGVPHSYRKELRVVTLRGGQTVTGLIYLMNGGVYELPTQDYLSRIITGYMEFGFHDYIKPVLYSALVASKRWCAADTAASKSN